MDWRGGADLDGLEPGAHVAIVFLCSVRRYLTLLGAQADRLDPDRIGPQPRRARGLLQPVADGVKLLLKEIILRHANKGLSCSRAVLMLMPALAAWA